MHGNTCMTQRTTDEILCFLVRNSAPEYHDFPVSESHVPRTLAERLQALLLRCSGTTRYRCPTPLLEEFLGEPVSFERHLRPLMESGALHFNGVAEPGSFYDSPSYREIFDHSTGRIKNYKTGESWVSFYYRENKFLDHHDQLEADAASLGLYRALKPKKRKGK